MKMSSLEKSFVNSASHSQRVSHYAEKLLKLTDFRAGQKYLDVGCGNGAAPIHLARTYHLEVIGVDVDPDQIRLAQEQSPGLKGTRFLAVDGGQLPFEAGEFDIVFTNKVTHHIPYWREVLAEMVRVLKPGGYFIYADLIYPDWLASLGELVAKNYAGFPSRAALEAFIEQQQLTRLHLKTVWRHYEAVLQKQNKV